jgi:DNA-binding response OmpR family regulator
VRRYQVYALGQDAYWLKAVARIADEAVTVEPIKCPASYLECLDHLPEVDPEALLLLDAAGDPNIEAVVRKLREQGWRYVGVVAADPYFREAHAVLEAGAYDYWPKSYVPATIRQKVEGWLSQMKHEHGEDVVPEDKT